MSRGGENGILDTIQETLASLKASIQVQAILDGVTQEPELKLALEDIGSANSMSPVKKLVDILKAHSVDLDQEGEIKPEDIKSRFTSVNLERCLTFLLGKYKESGNRSYLNLLRLIQRSAATSVAEKTLSVGEGRRAFHIGMPPVWTHAERIAYSQVVRTRMRGHRVCLQQDPTRIAAVFKDDEYGIA